MKSRKAGFVWFVSVSVPCAWVQPCLSNASIHDANPTPPKAKRYFQDPPFTTGNSNREKTLANSF
ncbi:hypothetical protein BLL52_3981 [Rhodoferax antarcticus ANT.BR]|uniref:Secreted protein n=1 Tax=Rhodoferax antarcticus ANT.BR TaxID=1111071 RepID=A0A1Q8YBH8_9BURK|nr:hypothetical protein BLL52_3981 [Rhodoferax antarcticus ANT.BR]